MDNNKNDNKNNHVIYIKLFDSTPTNSQNMKLPINKFIFDSITKKDNTEVDWNRMNNLSKIIRVIMYKFKMYGIRPGDTIILYVRRHENIHLLSQIMNICIYLQCPLLLEVFEEEGRSFSDPILMWNADNASTKYINRVTWYSFKVKINALDKYITDGIYEPDYNGINNKEETDEEQY